MTPRAKPNILVGTASWTDKSLVQSGWYPKGVNSAEDRLRYYGEHFPIVEADSTYYFPPTTRNSQLWADRSPAGFTFNIKAFSLLTGHPTNVRALPKDMVPKGTTGNIYPKALKQSDIDSVWDSFAEALTPLKKARKLGFVLFQFPPWFTCTKDNRDYIVECAKRIAPLRICVEFRNHSWLDDDNQDRVFKFLETHDLPYVAVDMPQGFKSSVPPVLHATSDLALIRFHGHNDKQWESGSVQQRFAYKYSDKELKSWAPKVVELGKQAAETHVLMNNCHQDWAQDNAASLIELINESS